MLDRADAICIGETMVMVTPELGERLASRPRCLLQPGGAESNVASLLAALGHDARWASAVGDDELGELVVSAVADAGVDVSLVERRSDGPTGVYFKDPSPEGTSVFYYRSGSAASLLDASVVDTWKQSRARVVHLSGIMGALSSTSLELLNHIVFERPFGGAVVSFDVNHRPSLWAAEAAAPHLRKLAQASDIVFVGRDEAEELWGTGTVEQIRTYLPEPRHLIVKDAEIAAVEYNEKQAHSEVSPVVQVMDPVGAGDAFAAGWLSGWLSGRDVRERLRLGHLIASRVLTSPTDFAPPPTRSEIAAALSMSADQWHREGKLRSSLRVGN